MLWIDVKQETVPVEENNTLNLKYFIFTSYKT